MKKTGFILIAATVLVGIIMLSSCRDKKSEGSETVLATVNGRTITPEDFAISIDLLYPPSERPQFATPEGKEEFMDRLVVMEMFYQEGVAQGYEEDPRIKKILENYKRYLIFDTMMNRGVDESAMVNYFRNNFVHIAIIFVKKPDDGDAAKIAASKARIEKALAEITGGADFGDIAAKYSEHPSGAKQYRGDVGAITRSTGYDPELIDAAFTLTEQKTVSGVVEAKSGFYIVKLLDPAGAVPMKYLTTDIKTAIYRYLISQNYATYAAQLQSQAKVDVKKEVLDGIRLDQNMGVGGAPLQSVPQEGVPGVDPKATPPQ